MDTSLNEVLNSIKTSIKNYKNEIEELKDLQKLRESQLKLERAIVEEDLDGVRKNLPISGYSLETEGLIKLNIASINNEEKSQEILKLILRKLGDQEIPELSNCIADALDEGLDGHFKLLLLHNNRAEINDTELLEAAERVVSRCDTKLFNSILESGLYKKEWSTPLLARAILGDGKIFEERLIDMGADPTANGTHEILFMLDNAIRFSQSSKNEKKVDNFIKYYRKEDIQSIFENEDLKDKLHPYIEVALEVRLSKLNAKEIVKKLKDCEIDKEI